MFYIPDLHSFGPVAELFPQQKIVEAAGTDEEEELFEDERDDLGVQAVLGKDGVEPGEEPKHPVQRLLGVDLLFGIPALTVVVGQRLVAGRLAGQLADPADALVLQDGSLNLSRQIGL